MTRMAIQSSIIKVPTSARAHQFCSPKGVNFQRRLLTADEAQMPLMLTTLKSPKATLSKRINYLEKCPHWQQYLEGMSLSQPC